VLLDRCNGHLTSWLEGVCCVGVTRPVATYKVGPCCCVQENHDVKDTLSNPIIDDDKKKKVLSTIAREAGFTESTLSFLSLLVDARRIDAIDEIVEAFETKYCLLTDTQVRCTQLCIGKREASRSSVLECLICRADLAVSWVPALRVYRWFEHQRRLCLRHI